MFSLFIFSLSSYFSDLGLCMADQSYLWSFYNQFTLDPMFYGSAYDHSASFSYLGHSIFMPPILE